MVFVEVKSRATLVASEWTGLENLDRRKRTALRRSCNAWRRRLPPEVENFRVDVVGVEFRRGRWRTRVHDIRWYTGVLDLDARSG